MNDPNNATNQRRRIFLKFRINKIYFLSHGRQQKLRPHFPTIIFQRIANDSHEDLSKYQYTCGDTTFSTYPQASYLFETLRQQHQRLHHIFAALFDISSTVSFLPFPLLPVHIFFRSDINQYVLTLLVKQNFIDSRNDQKYTHVSPLSNSFSDDLFVFTRIPRQFAIFWISQRLFPFSSDIIQLFWMGVIFSNNYRSVVRK